MERDYEIFECLPDGSVMWRARAIGLHDARLKLDRLLGDSGQEYFAMHLLTREIIFATDISRVESERASRRIFQIAYTDELRISRAQLLRSLGFSVISVMGNEAAKSLLSILRRDNLNIALFIIGHAAPAQTRIEMVDWLKVNYPMAKILALNPPDQQIEGADYNATKNGPETWLPWVATNLSGLSAS